MTRCYITIQETGFGISTSQRFKIRTDSDGDDYIIFQSVNDICKQGKVPMMSNKIDYIDERELTLEELLQKKRGNLYRNQKFKIISNSKS